MIFAQTYENFISHKTWMNYEACQVYDVKLGIYIISFICMNNSNIFGRIN